MEKINKLSDFYWESPDGFADDIEQVIIENTLDEVIKKGVRTRFVRFHAGAKTDIKFIHDYHEEVYLVEGDQVLLDETTMKPITKYNQGEYFVRPAGTYHGPFTSQAGCLLLEIHYYGEKKQ